ncbi:ABC transporter ATP-binding protein [Neobacillus niacini]|uniref:ABC transporter ATP-binding protein n=1 Tax=Neobacillus niacini TaxID=86668 RepID=UPI002FFDD565
MLELRDIHVHYGPVHALKGVNLSIPPGKIVSLLGANGAGKSTALKAISRLIPVTEGEYEMDGFNLLKKSASDIVRIGIIHCPENRRIFPDFTVEENLKIGTFHRKDKGNFKRDFERVFTYFPRLRDRFHQKGGTLSGGEQQMLSIGRALMGNPSILLLDEPSLGLAPILVKEIFEIIKEINKEGKSILLVEQNANMAMSISHYSYVLENGRITLEGLSDEIASNPKVKESYLGTA